MTRRSVHEEIESAIRVRHLQTSLGESVWLASDTSEADAVRALLPHGFEQAPVVDAGLTVGLVLASELDPGRRHRSEPRPTRWALVTWSQPILALLEALWVAIAIRETSCLSARSRMPRGGRSSAVTAHSIGARPANEASKVALKARRALGDPTGRGRCLRHRR